MHVFAIGVLSVAVIQLALHDLAIGAPGLGLLEGALAVGGIAGGAVALGQAARHTAVGAVRLASVLWALPLCAAVAVVNPVAAAVGLAIAGIGNVLLDVTVYTHVQETTDEPVLARTVAALQSITVAAVGLGSLAAGIALSTLGTAATLGAIGLLVPVTAAILAPIDPAACTDLPGRPRAGATAGYLTPTTPTRRPQEVPEATDPLRQEAPPADPQRWKSSPEGGANSHRAPPSASRPHVGALTERSSGAERHRCAPLLASLAHHQATDKGALTCRPPSRHPQASRN